MLIDDLELTSTNQQEYSATFKATETNNFYIGFRLLTTGSFFSNRVYLHSIKVEEGTDQGVPAAVSNLTITPATGGQLKATVAFKSPTQSIGGTTLSSITKIDVYRNNSIVKTFNTPTPGQQLSYEDIVGASGKYTYRIVATNELGEGEGVEQEAFIGMDEPGNVTNVRFVYNYETKTSTITWDAPTVGKNGGYIDTSEITYNIRRFHAKEPVATGLTATTFEDVVDIDFLLEEEERMRQEYADIGMPVNITYVIDDEGLRDKTYVNPDKTSEGGEDLKGDGDILIDTHGEYREVPARIAQELNVPFIDANKITSDLEQNLGVEGSKKLHMIYLPGECPAYPKGRQDNTHYNQIGARIVAGLLAIEIGKQVPEIKRHLK